MNALNGNVFLPAQNALNARNAFEDVPDVPMSDSMMNVFQRQMGNAMGHLGQMAKASFFKRDVATVPLRQLRAGEPSATATTAQALREQGFVWLDFEGDLLLNEAMGRLEDVAKFLEKNEGQGSPHASCSFYCFHMFRRY